MAGYSARLPGFPRPKAADVGRYSKSAAYMSRVKR
jgi:hypothetical protein